MKHRVAAIQMTSGHNVSSNLIAAKTLIAQAADSGAKLIVLPEMFAVMGLDQMDKVNAREKWGDGPIQEFLHHEAIQHNVWIVGGTIPIAVEEDAHQVHAACLVVNHQGEVVARYDKMHLFDVRLDATQEVYSESRTTTSGSQIIVIPTPFGKLGLAVCYDIRFPEMFRNMHELGVEVLALPAAFTFITGSVHWDILVRARAIENQIFVIAAAQTGVHPSGRRTYGYSMVVDPWGGVKASLPYEQGVVLADIDLDYLVKIRKEFPVLSHRKL